MSRISLRGIDTTGADATNDTPRYNPDTDRLEYAPGGGGTGGVQSIVPGSGIAVDNTDPANPVVSATGSGGTGGASGASDWDYLTYPHGQGNAWQMRETRIQGTWGYAAFTGVGGGMLYNTSNAQNDAIAFTLWLGAGTYDLYVVGGADANRAIQTWEVDDGAGTYSTLGTIDWYAAATANNTLKHLSIAVSGATTRRNLKATVKTRNASCVGWFQSIQELTLIRAA